LIQAFLVDDEEHALTILELFLERIGGVEVIGRSNNGFDALRQLRELKPDVLFLDIEMPEMNGIELAEILRNQGSDVHLIFATAYDQYALQAFDQAAIDYILKPLEMDRLSKTVARLTRELEKTGKERSQAVMTAAPVEPPRFLIRLMGPYYAGAEGGSPIKWRTNKEKEVLAYLSAQSDFRSHRDRIIEDVWPDEKYDKAKVYLHTCISLLRKHMKQSQLEGIIKYEDERYYLDPERIDVDVRSFKQHLQGLKQTGEPTLQEIENALSYHSGQLLQDEDYPWASHEAEALERSASEWRLALGELYLGSGQYDKAAATAETAIEHSPYEEEAYRLLMRAYHGLGKNHEVHLTYLNLVIRLEELQIKPSKLSRKLYEDCCT
jgi:two-component SAPR family response regulator